MTMLGKHHSEETKMLMSETKKGKLNSGNFKKGDVTWMKGKHHSRESRRKISESHKGLIPSRVTIKKMSDAKKGKKRLPFSEETRNRISESRRAMNFEYKKGADHPMFGKHHTKESLSKMSKSLKGKTSWNKGMTTPLETRKKQSIARINRVFPFKDTSIEVKLQQALRIAGIGFTTHKPILGQPDVFIEPNICIFADGCYWHSCNQCVDRNKFNDYQRKRIITDQFVTARLNELGFVVLRFWEHQINADVEGCIEQIKKQMVVKSNENIK